MWGAPLFGIAWLVLSILGALAWNRFAKRRRAIEALVERSRLDRTASNRAGDQHA